MASAAVEDTAFVRRLFLPFSLMLQAPTGLETHGPLGTLWVSLGLICFYIALIWINTLLGVFITPLFIIPQTWLLDRIKRGKGGSHKPSKTA
jgi:hypothetical protein